MKINVFESAQVPDPELNLRLMPSDAYANGVDLYAVTRDGTTRLGGRILLICEEGIFRPTGVSPYLGLPVGKEHRAALAIHHNVKERIDRLGRVLEGKEGHTTLLSNGAEVVRISDIRAILDYLR